MKYFVVSDVHSFYTEMIEALKLVGYDKENVNHTLVLCGDAFDRGEESVEMLNFLQSLPEDRFVYVRGNHEDLLEDAVIEVLSHTSLEYIHSHHFSNGTIKTIKHLTGMHLYEMFQRSLQFSCLSNL